jgi:hypothetical protein
LITLLSIRLHLTVLLLARTSLSSRTRSTVRVALMTDTWAQGEVSYAAIQCPRESGAMAPLWLVGYCGPAHLPPQGRIATRSAHFAPAHAGTSGTGRPTKFSLPLPLFQWDVSERVRQRDVHPIMDAPLMTDVGNRGPLIVQRGPRFSSIQTSSTSFFLPSHQLTPHSFV